LAVKRLNRAESDRTIQGYHDGHFWERNSLADQKQGKDTNKVSTNKTQTIVGLFDEQYS
jgi:site-specific DNA-methyltransferase (adenine-specific)